MAHIRITRETLEFLMDLPEQLKITDVGRFETVEGIEIVSFEVSDSQGQLGPDTRLALSYGQDAGGSVHLESTVEF